LSPVICHDVVAVVVVVVVVVVAAVDVRTVNYLPYHILSSEHESQQQQHQHQQQLIRSKMLKSMEYFIQNLKIILKSSPQIIMAKHVPDFKKLVFLNLFCPKITSNLFLFIQMLKYTGKE
jgi:hypothetical protein